MSITEQHQMEGLSRACLQAIAARAGLNLSMGREFDYGIDGTIYGVEIFPDGRRLESGYFFNFQLKASTRWQLVETEEQIAYDLEAKTYNDLIDRQQSAATCLLILLALPSDRDRWLSCARDGTTIGGGCYWEILQGEPTQNRSTERIFIPLHQQLDPGALLELLERSKIGQLP